MSSMRRLARLLESQKENGSHCLVEWDEPGNPRNVVQRKTVVSKDGEENSLTVGELYNVQVQMGSKKAHYPAKLLGIGNRTDMEKALKELEEREDRPVLSACEDNEETGSADPGSEDEKSAASESEVESLSESEGNPPEDSSTTVRPKAAAKRKPARRRQTKTAAENSKKSNFSKKKCAEENNRVTEELLAGLDTPGFHSNSGLTSPSPCSPLPSPREPTNFGSRKRAHSDSEPEEPQPSSGVTLTIRQPFSDITNTSDLYQGTSMIAQTPHTSTPIFSNATVFRQQDSLKEWLEIQFKELHRKVDAVMEAQQQLRSTILRKKSKKAQFELSTGGNVEDLGQEDDEPTCTGLQVCCGKAGVRGKHSVVTLPSEAARAEFVQVNACPPSNPAKFALKLLSVFFTQDELAESNCTKADGRKLLDQDILQAIKHQTNLKYPAKDEEARWLKIVVKSLNSKCRSARRERK